ncbi:MAG TPA: ABC transporter ATP-binding protein [Defluviitaleaceae bacterium]|nr:ABC transporter ATP-binding protein [Candidatus Epulonipiscium sp.]HOQ17711.1 ABC transporter ATP-binding protein [Defluviitaleaceae bacterium]HPT75587.1 ABC transporter ATP-binding protein [Defluviitaleaceae bacterium]HQD50090.1 ABC transporter ATP-binding protein [Defluviitaleaceae bacterium]
MTPIVELKSVAKTYHTPVGETKALENLSLTINKGEFISIVGPSGCGKSTILSLIAGLIQPSDGEVLVFGSPVTGTSSKIGYMLQKDHLFEWRSILSNVYLGLEIQKKLTDENKAYVNKLLDIYGLADFKNRFPSELSGGMRQRVALIRTLAIRPEILLLDEPFSALDYQTRLIVSDEIGRIIKKESKTAILVTHDIAEAISMADKVVVLTERPGKIKASHDIKLSIDNRTPFKSREAPEFREYFNIIWKELKTHESESY